MKALLTHDVRLRIVGPIACLALLLYGAVSFTKPQHSYFLTFSSAQHFDGAFQARISLDNDLFVTPVKTLRGKDSLHVVALPTRTVRGIRLIAGKNIGDVRSPQIVRVATPIREASAEGLSGGTIYRSLDVDAKQATPDTAQSSFDLDLKQPLYLLYDTQISWMQRLVAALMIGTLILWLLGRTRLLPLAQAHPRIVQLFRGPVPTAVICGLWAASTFAVYFIYAGRIAGFGWNIVEFIIANHLQDAGRYALGATYPTAVWRPVGPTFIVLALDAVARDPLLTYQILAGLALASFTASVYLLNRFLFGQLLANAGAALAFATPVATVSLINHTHSISHLCFLLVASPTLLASVICIMRVRDDEPSSRRWLWLASAGWALCYLCRPESMLMAACFFFTVAVLLARRKRALHLLAPATLFIVIFAGFNFWASASAARDDLLSRKMIYLFYASQGWVDLFDTKKRAEMPTDDFEMHGYVRAIQLYGTPENNHESVTYAIAQNTKAFAERIGTNLRRMTDLFAKEQVLPFALCLLLLLLPFAFTFLKWPFRVLLLYGIATFSILGLFLVFHIDDRYLTIAAPAAVFLGSLSAHALSRAPMPARFGQNAFSLVVLGVALLHLPAHFTALSQASARERLDLSIPRLIGEGFRSAARARSVDTAPLIVHLDIPSASGSNATLLFPYFARTSAFWPLSSESYPRDRLFSLPQCAATHAIAAVGSGYDNKLGTFFVPQIGELGVFQLAVPSSAPAEGSFAARHCPPRKGG